jgi:hypothetical protein
VLDFGTVNTIKEMFPASFREEYAATSAPENVDARLALLERLEKHQERVVLGEYFRRIGSIIQQKGIDLVGFKLWHGDGFRFSIMLMEKIRKDFPSVRICAGGPQADIYGADIFARAAHSLDALIIKEGERAFALLADFVDGKCLLRDVPNLLYRENGMIERTETQFIQDLDSLPFPAYQESVYLAMAGDQKIKLFVLDESRGCNQRCHFCLHPSKSGGKIRLKSGSRILEEIDRLEALHGAVQFRLAGSNTPARFLLGLAEALLGRGSPIRYDSFAHVSNYLSVGAEDLRKLQESGCASLSFGLESANDTVLAKGMNKNFSSQQARDVLFRVRDSGIDLIVSMIFPAPFDTEWSEAQTLSFLSELRPTSILTCMPGFYKSTEWGMNPGKFQIELPSDFFDKFISYKFKMLYPPQYWDPLEFRLNGASAGEVMLQNFAFREKLKAHGLCLAATEIINTLASSVGRSPEQAVAFWQDSLMTGDDLSIGEEVRKINAAITRKYA